jgi:4-amino-4-deoxy-L-arabinose transferase-like glycosyltransferase
MLAGQEKTMPALRSETLGQARSPLFSFSAVLLLAFMAVLAGCAALRETAAIDEVAHIGAGLSYLQKLDLRLNEEHPPLAKVLAALPLVLRGTHADYSSPSWTVSRKFLPQAYVGQWVFGDWVLTRWNDPVRTLAWARLPMLILTLALGWVIYVYAGRLGGPWAGLLCLSAYVTTPLFLTFGPLVLTDVAVTLFSLLALWTFADVWQRPGRRSVVLFALCLGAALLSKFSAGLLFFCFGLFGLSTRWRAVPGQPIAKAEVRAWRRARWWATAKGVLCAAFIVYAVYFIFSWNQTTDVLYLLGQGSGWVPVRRLLMPPWLYLRGLAMVALTFVRPTFLLGRNYPHGVWFYFPVLFVLKSPLGFLGLLASALGLALVRKRGGRDLPPAVSPETAIHWRVLWVALLLFLSASIVSHFDISIRHFSMPMVLLILLLAPLPRMLQQLRESAASAARAMSALVVVLAVSCLFTAARTYPHYFPYMNALGMGRPAYVLASDSNVDWNQALPEVKQFAEQHGLQNLAVDYYGFSDAARIVPQAHLWNCQRPTAADAGQWVVVSADMILDTHNCSWLLQYPRQALAAGGMYAFHLPAQIPAAGTSGGPPLPPAQREFVGFPGDMRVMFLDTDRDPEKLRQATADMEAEFARAMKERKKR